MIIETVSSDQPEVIKTVKGHTGMARFLATLDLDSEGMPVIVREIPTILGIRSPYAGSPTMNVYRWKGREVVISEVYHGVHKVYAV